nr:fimbrial protein [Serratia ureilytica]
MALVTGAVQAASPSATVTVKVTVMAAPACVVNDNNPIEVEFGDVLTTRVDGSNYRRPVVYDLTCDGATSNAMKLQVRGTGAGFDATVLGTAEQPALGIELQQGSGKLAVNDWLNFSYPDKPQLYAVPVKQAGATLTTGTFSAAATLAVAYQ